MSQEKNGNKMSRREFLRLGGAAAGGAIIGAAGMRGLARTAPVREVVREVTKEVVVTPAAEEQKPAPAKIVFRSTLPYPRVKVANAKDLQPGKLVTATYPDAQSPIVVVKFGRPVGGVGPDQDIVAYSQLCTHMGCPLSNFDPERGTLTCGCHYSTFDLSKGGMMVIGLGTDNLPEIVLEYDEGTGDIYAVGVRGLIYGRLSNILSAEQA